MSLSTKLIPFTLLVLTQAVLAATPPGAGSQIQQIPVSPTQQKARPDIRIEPAAPGANPVVDNVKILVQKLLVTGAHGYSEEALIAITRFTPGTELSLTELHTMAERIADHYHRDGYLLAQAYLPAQDIKNGVVTIAVVEGQYGKITVNNHTNVSNGVINSYLGGLHSGDVVRSAPLESSLLLLSDLAGVEVKSTLVPGASVGASDLIVEVTPARRISGEVDADNAGNRYTGANRIGATVNLNEPLGLGDTASLRVLTSGSGLNYARASYQLSVGKAKVGVAYSALRYVLGEEFEPLHANGTAKIASVYANYPLIRSRDTSLYAQVAFDSKAFRDRVDATSSVSDKRSHVLMTSLYGEQRDSFGGGGVTNGSATLAAGNLDIQTPEVLAVDALTAQSNGHFNKLNVSLARLQSVTERLSLYASFNGQVASKNLDISEKMELGGMNGVRAYPEGEAFADQGYLLDLEARYLVRKSSPSSRGNVELIGFVDSGTVTLNKNPWVDGPNRRTLSGAGVGINVYEVNDYTVRAYYARKLGSEPATSAPDRSGRFWIQAVKYF